MLIRTISLLLLLLLPFFAAPAAGGESRSALETANRLLRAELELARTSQVYILFDLREGPRVLLKGNGVTVAELPVTEVRLWGGPPVHRVHTVGGKDTLFPPKRQKIEAAGKEDTGGPSRIQGLELDDMPTTFRVRLEDGTRLTIRPAPAGLASNLWECCRTSLWYLSRPLISDWHFFRRKSYTEVRLLLPVRDARLLYWSLTEGASCLIAWPAPLHPEG